MSLYTHCISSFLMNLYSKMKPNLKTHLLLPVLGTCTVAVLTLPAQQRGGKTMRLAGVALIPNAFQDIGRTWVWIYISAGGRFTFQPLDLCEKLLSHSPCNWGFSSSQLMNIHRLNTSGKEDTGSWRILRSRKQFLTISMNENVYIYIYIFQLE